MTVDAAVCSDGSLINSTGSARVLVALLFKLTAAGSTLSLLSADKQIKRGRRQETLKLGARRRVSEGKRDGMEGSEARRRKGKEETEGRETDECR